MMMWEEWKPVTGTFAGYEYLVSSQGRVMSRRPAWPHGRILKPIFDKDGYLRVNLFRDAHSARQVPIHLLVAEAFIGPRPDGRTVNHRDFDKANNRPSNLEWITTQENTEHARAAGRMKASTAKRLATRKLRALT